MSVDPNNIISLGNELLGRYPGTFTARFTENRRQVERVTDIRSRRVQNRIAGYITRNYPDTGSSTHESRK
ncbi:30S ribosomal protein S17e [Salinibaculum salinum]|uniref:30S ribosomal protein S17e n=1 Tax=Salinibaculum salinum TaxID=3131996 RepID=UPI0030EB26A7